MMITKIEVDGFKSLRNFDLNLIQGLNILVGPNGAGKTNIILFFEFLSNLVTNQVGNAISSVGGAGSIFQKIGRDKYADSIKSKIYGSFQIQPKQFIVYEYSFEIKISFEKDDVFFSNQEIKLRSTSKFWESPDSPRYRDSWSLQVKFINVDGRKPETTIVSFDKKKINSHFFATRGKNEKEFGIKLKEYIDNQDPTYHSIIRCLVPLVHHIYPVLIDLKGGETVNIIPSKVRELEDSATPPGVKKDGAGLASTLYAMKKNKTKYKERQPKYFFGFADDSQKNYNPRTLDKIISFLKAANSTITNLDVDNDPFNNKLMVKIDIKTGDYEAVLPLSSMSDGTIKWLTLITAILTSKTIFSIEEPENFLHPWMQAEIATIMRTHLQEKKSQAFVLMTTHSESLLNHAKPEEIIIVDLTEGRTKARRVGNVKAIKDEISNSGFGLGHFYFSNALNDE